MYSELAKLIATALEQVAVKMDDKSLATAVAAREMLAGVASGRLIISEVKGEDE